MTALRVRLINFSKLQMVPHLNSGWNDRHFLLLIPGPASLAPKSSLCIKLGPSSIPPKKKKSSFFFVSFSSTTHNRSWWTDGECITPWCTSEGSLRRLPIQEPNLCVCIYMSVYHGPLWALQLPDSNFSVTGSISILIQSHGISSRWISPARGLAASAGSWLPKSLQTSPYPPGDYTAQLPG